MLICATIRRVKVRHWALLVGSVALYVTWQPWFGAVLLSSIAVNFLLGAWTRRNASWVPVVTGALFNVGLLSVFKYVPQLVLHLGPNLLQSLDRLALPLGISFWTFQALSYLIDQYREEELDPSFVEFALYMTFFPVTISGPVCRMPDMLPQFRKKETASKNEIRSGLQRIAIGILMMQLAKLLGQGVLAGDGIVSGFNRTTHWSGADVWCLAFGYGLQLFFDFAGYSHIAIGAARALGITVPENFARPFASTTPSVFWTRWHMSLSFWIRDYVFFPLAPLRREMWWRNLALAFSMVIFGLWHKATVLFLIWGGYHGALLVLHRQIQQIERKYDWNPGRLWTFLSWGATTAAISLGWIFFRANSLLQAWRMLAAALSPGSYTSHGLSLSLYLLVGTLAAGYALVLATEAALDRYTTGSQFTDKSRMILLLARWRWFWIPSLYALALLFVFMVTHGQEANAGQLMYRQF